MIQPIREQGAGSREKNIPPSISLIGSPHPAPRSRATEGILPEVTT